MATRLPPPPTAAELAKLKLRIKEVEATRLYRISRFTGGEPHFGRSGANRFDDPAMVFSTGYLGLDLPTAVGECGTVVCGHLDLQVSRGRRNLSASSSGQPLERFHFPQGVVPSRPGPSHR